ncbi:MAG: hypothetical protein IPL53_13280 [Ignavibacteria bacterium]|nr:hypothetical protein [Ignavibacteria bacterium]
MSNKLILKASGIFVLMIMIFTFFSCSKTEKENMTKEEKNNNTEEVIIDEKDFLESDEDLTTVDYKEFYDRLTPYGEWVQVQPEEIGLQSNTAQSNNSNNDLLSMSDLIGIKEAHAIENTDMVFVWKPSIELAVKQADVEVPVYRPYTNGQWVNSDAGWYFKAPTPVEETVSHYGRWVNSPTAGWLWVPGRVWAPAWVDWKQNDQYLSWAPLPPAAYLKNSTVNAPVIEDKNYVIVEKKYFLEPDLYRYTNFYNKNVYGIPVSEMKGTTGIIVVNNTIVSKGPDVNIFEALLGRIIEPVKIVRVVNYSEVRYADKEYVIYTPVFRKYKNKDQKRITAQGPKSFKKYEEWKVLKAEEKILKKEEKDLKKEEKDLKKEEKEIRKENNGKDNGSRNNDNDNGKKNNDKERKNNGDDNKNKGNGDDNGNKNNDNSNGNKNNGKDKGKGK